MNAAVVAPKRKVPVAVIVAAAAVGAAGWVLDKAHDPKPDEIARFLSYELRGDQGVAFDATGAAVAPAPVPAAISEAECVRSSGGSDFDEWACFYTYTDAAGATFRTVLQAMLVGSIFRNEDRFNMRDVGMYNIGLWAEGTQRDVFANFGRPLP